jgi:hypothetical protein
MFEKIHLRQFIGAFAKLICIVTQRSALHAPAHVGAFAGSYLERRDWDHA